MVGVRVGEGETSNPLKKERPNNRGTDRRIIDHKTTVTGLLGIGVKPKEQILSKMMRTTSFRDITGQFNAIEETELSW